MYYLNYQKNSILTLKSLLFQEVLNVLKGKENFQNFRHFI